MKKTIFFLAGILIIVYVTLSILGGGGEYAAEKLYFRAMKTNLRILRNPDVVPPGLLSMVEKDLKNITIKYPKTKTAVRSNVALIEFYITHQKYADAFSVIAAVEKNTKNDLSVLSTVQFLKGIAFEKQGAWDKALVAFKVLQNKYPNTELGLQSPLYIGRHYESAGKIDEANKAYAEAATFYKDLEKEHTGTLFGYMASGFIIQANLSMKDYAAAGESLDSALNKYPSSMTYSQLLPYVEFIYVEKLNNPKKAIEVYDSIIKNTKDSQATKFLKQRIEKLKIKDKT